MCDHWLVTGLAWLGLFTLARWSYRVWDWQERRPYWSPWAAAYLWLKRWRSRRHDNRDG